MSGQYKRISVFSELGLLIGEYATVLFGNIKNLLVTLLFPVMAAVITVWIAGENMFVSFEGTKSGCFVLVSAAIWGGLFNSIQTVVKERALIKRNLVSGGMRLWCYTFSRALLQFVLCFIQSLILCTAFIGVSICYKNNLPEEGILTAFPMMEYFLTLLLLTYSADAMGLMISCIVKKPETASVMAPYILIVQLIFSGILFELQGFSDKVSLLMLSRWGMEGLGSISDLNSIPRLIQINYPKFRMDDAEPMAMFKHTGSHLWIVWGVMLLFILFFIITGDLLLHRVAKDSRD